MGDIHKVLDMKAEDIVWRLSCPDFMARVYLRRFLSDVECERIESQTKNWGDSVGAITLLELIKKKDATVFEAFLDALRKQALEDLAEELKDLRIQARRTESRGCDKDPKELNPDSGNPGPDTLLRHIPEDICQKMVFLLNTPSPNDWRAIASHMGLNAEDVQGMEDGKTQTLFRIMFEQNWKVQNLLELLLAAKRNDVIDELKNRGIVRDADLRNSTYRETEV